MKVQQFEFAKLEYDKQKNILFYKVKQGIVVDVFEMSQMILYVIEFIGYKEHYAVVDFGANVLSTTEARKLYASSDYIQKYRKADAFVVKSLSVRLVANFFIKVTKPLTQTKLFVCEIQATKWLENLTNK